MSSLPIQERRSGSGRLPVLVRTSTSHVIRIVLSSLGFVLVLIALTMVYVGDRDSNWRTECSTVTMCVFVLAAWSFPRWPVIACALSATLVCGWADIHRSANWQIGVLGLLVQMTATLLLIAWTSRARRLLERARQFARVDSLTGLPNRQAILESLDSELCRVARFGRPFSIAMLDCDDFKSINDLHGHLTGDRLLQGIATALRSSTRAYDCIGRLGGDEFVLILPETDVDEIPMVVERLRAALRLELVRQYPQLTFSIGVLTIQSQSTPNDSVPDRTACLQRVDELMYAAKHSGRDQTRFETFT